MTVPSDRVYTEYRTKIISADVTCRLDVRSLELPPIEVILRDEVDAAMDNEAAEEFEEVEA